MLEGVDGAVVDRGLVEPRNVPDVEVDRPERQRDQWVREDQVAKTHAALKRQQRTGEAEHECERREVAEDDVLEHVNPEQLLLARHLVGDREQDE